MLYKMQLAPQPMSKIKSGRKTIELRLYDENSVKTASPKDMNIYYSKERQAEYGVVGIETEVIR